MVRSAAAADRDHHASHVHGAMQLNLAGPKKGAVGESNRHVVPWKRGVAVRDDGHTITAWNQSLHRERAVVAETVALVRNPRTLQRDGELCEESGRDRGAGSGHWITVAGSVIAMFLTRFQPLASKVGWFGLG